jgi:hypothetical protein
MDVKRWLMVASVGVLIYDQGMVKREKEMFFYRPPGPEATGLTPGNHEGPIGK